MPVAFGRGSSFSQPRLAMKDTGPASRDSFNLNRLVSTAPYTLSHAETMRVP